jgi:phosphoglycolate phosphatase
MPFTYRMNNQDSPQQGKKERSLLAVWDWNGTLFDDMAATHVATNASLAFFGKGPITLEEEQENFTFPLIHFYEKMNVPVDDYLEHAEEVGNLFHDIYNRESQKCALADGAVDALDWLQSHGVQMMILSNHRQKALDRDVSRFGLDGYFDLMSGNEKAATIVRGLNKLHRLEAYMQQNGFAPEDTFIIGDSHEEPEIAKKLGLLGISISGGLMSARRLAKYKKDYVIDSLRELPDILGREWNLAPPAKAR